MSLLKPLKAGRKLRITNVGAYEYLKPTSNFKLIYDKTSLLHEGTEKECYAARYRFFKTYGFENWMYLKILPPKT